MSPEPVRITTAPVSRADDLSSRQRRYVVSMAIRAACLVLALVVDWVWLRWLFIAGAVFLPYVAVVMANAVHSRSDDFELDRIDHREIGPSERP